jgi:hypothetical protein
VAKCQEVKVKARNVALSMVVVVGGAALVGAQPACGARVTVRQVGMQPNDDGTRTLKYRANVQIDPPGVCTRVSFSLMRSYVKGDGSTVEAGLPLAVEVQKRSTLLEGDDVLPTSRLVYWWTDDVRCEPCPGGQAAAPAQTSRSSAPAPAAAVANQAPSDAPHSKPRKKAALTVGAVAIGAILLL